MNHYRYGIYLLLYFLILPAQAYYSSYDKIQWDPRWQSELDYCVDLMDENYQVYEGLRAVVCGTDLYEFSPHDYVSNHYHIELPDGFEFYWRIWSVNGYGGDGFEGKVTVGELCGLPYRSDLEQLQWSCRFQDSYYCIDLYDSNQQPIRTPAACGENLHSYNPKPLLESLDVPSGTYYWKVWSEHTFNYIGQQKYLEGSFQYAQFLQNAQTTYEQLEPLLGSWQISYVENNQVIDLRYQLDNIVERNENNYVLVGNDSLSGSSVSVVYEPSRQSYLLTDSKNNNKTRYIRFNQNSRTALWSGYTFKLETEEQENQVDRFPIQGRRFESIFNKTTNPNL